MWNSLVKKVETIPRKVAQGRTTSQSPGSPRLVKQPEFPGPRSAPDSIPEPNGPKKTQNGNGKAKENTSTMGDDPADPKCGFKMPEKHPVYNALQVVATGITLATGACLVVDHIEKERENVIAEMKEGLRYERERNVEGGLKDIDERLKRMEEKDKAQAAKIEEMKGTLKRMEDRQQQQMEKNASKKVSKD